MINRKETVNNSDEIGINKQKNKNVEMFKYLDSLLTNSNEVETKIKASIITGNKCYHALACSLKERYKTPSLSVGLYKIIIR
jgi:hypothetical protein